MRTHLHGVLHPCLELSAQERNGPLRVSPEKDHEDDERDGAERFGTIYPGEENASGRPYSSFLVPKEDLQENRRGIFYKGM